MRTAVSIVQTHQTMAPRKRKTKTPHKGQAASTSSGWEALDADDKVRKQIHSAQDGNNNQRKSSRHHLLLIFAIVSSLILYYNTLPNEFVYDDLIAVVQNPDVRGERPLSVLFKSDFWGAPLASAASHKSYRPVTTLLYRLTASVSGMEPRAFHMMNMLVNALAVGLAVKCVEIVYCSDSAAAKKKESQLFGVVTLSPFVAITSALYAFHPIHTESVNCIVGMADLLAAVFGLLAFIYHDKSNSGGIGMNFLACLVLSWLAALAKEPGLMILAICGAREIVRYWIPALGDRQSSSSVIEKTMFMSSVVRFVLLASTGVAFLLFRKYINGDSNGMSLGDSVCDNPLVTAETTLSYALTAMFVMTMYVWKLINPTSLLCDYGYNTIPLVEGVGDFRNLATYAVIVAVLALTKIGISDAINKDRPDGRILIALAWIFFPLLPASHIMTIGTVLAERLLYLPSLGYCMLLAVFVERLQSGTSTKNDKRKVTTVAIIPALVVVLALFAQRIISRNQDWKDNRTLWNTDHFTNPANVKLAKAYGSELELAGKIDDAFYVVKDLNGLGAYQRVEVCLVKSRVSAMSKATGSSYDVGYYILDECIKEVESLPKMTTNSHQLYGSMGYLLNAQGKIQEAVPYFEKAAAVAEKVDKKNLQPICNVGEIYGRVNRWKDAVSFLERCVAWGERAREVKEKRAPALANLGLTYMKLGRYKEAATALQQSLSLHQTTQAVKFIKELKQITEKATE